MKLAIIGVGQAGGKILDKFLWYDRETGSEIVRSAVAVNTARADLMGLDRVPVENRLLVGQTRVKGHGVGADNELATAIFREDIGEIQGALDDIPVHEIDAFLVIAGLGGGTGSGGAPVIARHLARVHTEPVYGLGVLPGRDEGGIYTLNAARSFQTFVDEVDNLLVFDNDAWRRSGESVRSGYDAINEELVRRFGVLFSAGEPAGDGDVAQSVVDASEIINTLRGGGVSTIGYAVDQLEDTHRGFLSRFLDGDRDPFDGDADATNRVTSLVRKAALGRLTLPCEIDGVERTLVVVAGPSSHLDRKGIERARKWLEEETGSMEVRGGDYPLPGERKVAAVVVFSGITRVPRIKELQRVAIEAQGNFEAIRERSDADLRDLVGTDGDELRPLF